ncbi:MAG: isoaspartyl peptidase/L-asparaginase, partial [Emcibacter sp.]|nr:isoaspartyl peptidase/L-asparaginase [Emcibacter sp.]
MMRYLLAVIFILLTITAQAHEEKGKPYALVIHGGAGTILKKNMTPQKERSIRAKMAEALRMGQAVLDRGGMATEAVVVTLKVLEDSPLFNAGRGAVFTHEGRNEMDASLMDGRDLNAGAVAGVTHVKNPITLAREVMVHSKHVMLAGSGAEEFARTRTIEMVDAGYFRTEKRWQQLQKALQKEKASIEAENQIAALGYDPEDPDQKFGTVGAAALDSHGNLA